MRKLLAIALIFCASSLRAATGVCYATTGSTALASTTLAASSTGACTGSGTCVWTGSGSTWAQRGKNDTLDLNGCTALSIGTADPSPTPTTLTGTVSVTNGSTTVTGSGTTFTSEVAANDWVYVASQPPQKVSSVTNDTTLVLVNPWSGSTLTGQTMFDGIFTLQNSGSQTGNATLAASANTFHFITNNTTSGAKEVVTISGSTAGMVIYTNGQGGANAGAYAINDNHTTTSNLTIYGDFTGGSAGPGYSYSGAAGATINGTGYGGSGSAAAGISNSSSGTISVNGNGVGSDTANAPGLLASSTGPIVLTGNIIFGKRAAGVQGHIVFTPGASNCLMIQRVDAYGGGSRPLTCVATDTNNQQMPSDTNIKTQSTVTSGTVYGSYTGTNNGASNSGSVQ